MTVQERLVIVRFSRPRLELALTQLVANAHGTSVAHQQVLPSLFLHDWFVAEYQVELKHPFAGPLLDFLEVLLQALLNGWSKKLLVISVKCDVICGFLCHIIYVNKEEGGA
jgi:hypothetical protein